MRPRKTWVFLTGNEWSLVFINLVPRVGEGLSSTGEDGKRAGAFPWPDKTETLRKDHKQSIYYSPCWRFVLQTDISGKFNFVFFRYFSYHSSRDRKDQFTALILKFGIQTKKVQPWTARGLIVLYSSFSLKDSLQWSENWTRLIPEEQTS